MKRQQVQWLCNRREQDISKEVEKDQRARLYDAGLSRERPDHVRLLGHVKATYPKSNEKAVKGCEQR